MECWNIEYRRLLEGDLFFMDGKKQIVKTDFHSLLIPSIPFFHHSIIPLVF